MFTIAVSRFMSNQSSSNQRLRRLRITGILLVCAIAVLGLGAETLAGPLKTTKPERVGLSPERLQRLDAAMQDRVERKANSGMVILIARDGKVAYERAFGKASIERDTDMQTNSMFRLYSMTKPITSVALLQLYEQGKFQLTDPLSKYIPEFADLKVYRDVDNQGEILVEDLKRPPTVQDVFRHTAGFAYGVFGNTPVDDYYQKNDINYFKLSSLRDLIDKLAQAPLLYQPGKRWVYSFSHDVQAYLVEKLSGQSFDDYVREHILEPLEMNDTVFGIPDSVVERTVSTYSPLENAPEGNGPKTGAKGLSLIDDPRDQPPYKTVGLGGGYKRFTDMPLGGVSLLSTARDYARFGLMLINGGELDGVRILGRKTVEFMASNHLPEEIKGIDLGRSGGTGYGLGVSVTLDPAQDGKLGSTGAFGWTGAASTQGIFDPQENMVIITMGQYMPYDEAFLDQVKTLVYQSIVE